MSFRKIFVLGAGAIGSIYGALLSRKNDVTLIGNEAHVNAINTQGLEISGAMNETFFVDADTEIREIPEKTLIILTTKAQDSEKAIKRIAPLLKDDTVILILQNGLGNEEIVRKIVGDNIEVLRGLTMMAAEFLEPGKVKFWKGETVLEQSASSEKIAKIFNECGLETRLSDKIKEEIWKKLVFNCVINPLTALFKVRNYEIGVDTLRDVRRKIVRECIEVGRAEGIGFKQNLEEEIDKKILGYTNFSSMCQDIMKGKKTEIEFLNGKIVELGRKHNIPTPANEILFHLIKFMEEKQCALKRK